MTIKIAVSGAAGQIGYALLPLLANGHVFGHEQIELRLLEIPKALKSLAGTRMELLDCAFPTLSDVICTADPLEAFDNADVAVLVGGFPRLKGMQRKDLIARNTSIFTSMGKALNEVAASNVRVLVVANPANTNCLVTLKECSSRIPSRNFCALTYLDHQRAKSQIGQRFGVSANKVKNVTIWGNHSETQYPDALTDGYLVDDVGNNITLKSNSSAEDVDWINNEFVSTVQTRGKNVIEVRGSSSAMSAAISTVDFMKKWLVTGTDEGETISMAVYNDQGYYGIAKDIVFSFPCVCKNGAWIVKEGLTLSKLAYERLQITQNELLEEREAALELIEPKRKRSMSTSSSTTSMSTAESSLSDIESNTIVSKM